MIYNKIEKEIKKSILDKDNDKRDSLRFLKSEINKVAKDKRKDVTDDMSIEVIKHLIKQNEQTLSFCDDEKTKKEIEIWKSYLPKQIKITDDLIDDVITQENALSMKDMGKVMAHIKKKYGPNIDVAEVSKFVKEKLS